MTNNPQDSLNIENDFIQAYIDNVSRCTDAPRIFIIFTALGLLSSVLSKFYFFYPTRTHLNLYILLLAPSTSYRKTVCLNIANTYLRKTNEQLCFPDSFTPEALFQILSEQSRGIIFWPEFIQVKEFLLGKDYSKGTSELLTDLYDYKEKIIRRLRSQKDPIEIKNAIISILAAGIADWFTSDLREIDFMGGLWTRFIFVPAPLVKREYSWPEKHVLDEIILDAIRSLDRLEASELDLTKIKPYLIEWGNQHYREAEQLESDLLKASFLRLEAVLIKIAALLHLAQEKNTVVEPKAFIEAVKIIEFLKKSLSVLFNEDISFNEYDRRRQRVLRHIMQRESVSYSDLLRNVRGVNAVQLKAILEFLIEEGRILRENSQIIFVKR